MKVIENLKYQSFHASNTFEIHDYKYIQLITNIDTTMSVSTSRWNRWSQDIYLNAAD